MIGPGSGCRPGVSVISQIAEECGGSMLLSLVTDPCRATSAPEQVGVWQVDVQIGESARGGVDSVEPEGARLMDGHPDVCQLIGGDVRAEVLSAVPNTIYAGRQVIGGLSIDLH